MIKCRFLRVLFSTMHDPYLSHSSMTRPNFRTAAQRYLKQNFHAQNRSVNGKNTIEIKTSLDFTVTEEDAQ